MSDESSAAPPDSAASFALPPPPLPVSKVRWAIHLVLMASLPLLVAGLGAASHGTGPALQHDVRGLLIVCAFEVLFFAVPFALAWLASRATRDDLLLRWRPGFWVAPLGLVYSVGIRIFAGIVAVVAIAIGMLVNHVPQSQMAEFVSAHRPQVERLMDVDALANDPLYFWVTLIVVSFVIGGLREELWRSSFLAGLRALWPRAFGSTGGGIAGAAVVAVFFGIGHLPQGLLAVVVISVVGFLLGIIMTLHRSIWPSVFAHAFFDAGSVALIPWAMKHLHEFQHAAGGGS
jgi:membrane protease YdiL (CAAX protease family)